MGDSVGVPPFGQHGDGDHAADLFPEPTLPAHGVHDFPQHIGVRQIVSGLLVARPRHQLALELLDLGAHQLAVAGVNRLSGLQGLTVHQQRVEPGQAVAVLVVIPEQLEVSCVFESHLTVLVRSFIACDPLVNELAHHDEDRRCLETDPAPRIERFDIVAIEGEQRSLQFSGECRSEWIQVAGLACALFRHALADVFPELSVDGLAAGD